MFKKIVSRLRTQIQRGSKQIEDLNSNIQIGLTEPFSALQFGGACLQKVLLEFGSEFKTVLDIGSGQGAHSEIFRKYGKEVTEVDFGTSEYFQKDSKNRKVILGNYIDLDFDEKFDLVWACHVLEHQLNVNQFLLKVSSNLNDGGILAVTVPPLKHEVVGGHLTVWNAGLLMYNLVLAGFDCRDAKILQYDYNISLVLRKRKVVLPELAYDKGDIHKLSMYFPEGLEEPFDGNIGELNWTD